VRVEPLTEADANLVLMRAYRTDGTQAEASALPQRADGQPTVEISERDSWFCPSHEPH